MLSEELSKKYGFEKGDLGSHSCCKGVATMVAARSTVSPPIVSLCIRAGWILGGVKDKYLFRESAGDQYVGRCASCLDMLSKDFAVSPAYFDFSELNDEKRFEMEDKVRSILNERLPNYENFAGNAQNIAYHFFATICHHFDYLNENLHPSNPLRSSSIFCDIPNEIMNLARIAYPWNSTADTPRFSGIPPHVTHMAEMEALKAELVSFKTGLMVELGEAMDARGFASHEHNTDKILGAMNKHFEKMTIMAENSTRALNEASALARREASHAVIYDDDDIGNVFVTEIEDNLELSTF